MKKIFMLCFIMLMMVCGTMSAQDVQSNYAGSSKFTDNWSVTLQGGILTTFNDFYSGHTAMAPIIVLGVDKYVNPWFGLGVEGRTLIGTGHGMYNTHTAFDAVNVSGYAKVNILNAIKFTGERRMFEPVVYTGMGWGHYTASNYFDRNYITYRAGVECNFNLGKEKAWAVVVNPSVVWGGLDNAVLNKNVGNFEVTAGIVYHFKSSNGKRTFSKPVLYDADEVARLNAEIDNLKSINHKMKHELKAAKTVVREIQNATDTVAVDKTYVIEFAQGSANLTDDAKTVLNKIPDNVTVNILGKASPEGTSSFNQTLSQNRVNTVVTYLKDKNVIVNKQEAVGASMGNASNRLVLITIE